MENLIRALVPTLSAVIDGALDVSEFLIDITLALLSLLVICATTGILSEAAILFVLITDVE